MWGNWGNGPGQFDRPEGIAIDSSGNVYVADRNNRIQKFDSNGEFITKWGSSGNDTGQFDLPSKIAIDSIDNIYVSDIGNKRIQKFDSNGNYLGIWGSKDIKDGQFYYGRINIDYSDNVYLTIGDGWIQKFDKNGNFITKWGGYGNGTGQFDKPSDIAVDSYDNVYVVDTGNHRIQVFAPKQK
jgi:streptogramin lyase